MTPTGLIDVHAHFVTESYVAAARSAGIEHPDGMPGWPTWSVEQHLDLMDRSGIEKSYLSVSSPAVHFGDDDAARALAREVNEFGAGVRVERPQRFGHFASLPLPDVEGALAETAHALDVLGADGVAVETNHHGVYLGDPGSNRCGRTSTAAEPSSSSTPRHRPTPTNSPSAGPGRCWSSSSTPPAPRATCSCTAS